MDNSFDLIVLGAGSGGLAAAKRAASHGARVCIVEGDRVGGTCVIRGCVPKKLLVYGSRYRKYLDEASSFGVRVENASIDTKVLLQNVREEVDRLNRLHIELLDKAGVELVSGWASFNSQHSVSVSCLDNPKKEIELNGKNFLIAVGGRPNRPDIPGSNLGWVSDDVFLQRKFPDEVVVVGAGFIACEFSCILRALGVNVTQLVRKDYLLRGFDREISDALLESMVNKGIRFRFNETPVCILGEVGDLILQTSSEESLKCGGILFAIGRHPLLKGLDLGKANVNLDFNKIPVDINNQTNISNIYAVGDVTDRINLTPVAIDEGRALADRLFGDIFRTVDYELVPRAVFSQPEIAFVGITEAQAIQLFGPKKIKVFRTRFRSMSESLPKKGPRCLLKLVVQIDTERVIGCHMFGDHAAEIIQMAAIAIGMGATKKDFDKTMALHPTVSEEFVTMR